MEMAESKKPPCIAAEQERLQAHMAGTLIDDWQHSGENG